VHAGGESRDSSGRATSAVVVTPSAAPACPKGGAREGGSPAPPAPRTRCRVSGKGGKWGGEGEARRRPCSPARGLQPESRQRLPAARVPSVRTHSVQGRSWGASVCCRTTRTLPRTAKRGSPLISVSLSACARGRGQQRRRGPRRVVHPAPGSSKVVARTTRSVPTVPVARLPGHFRADRSTIAISGTAACANGDRGIRPFLHVAQAAPSFSDMPSGRPWRRPNFPWTRWALTEPSSPAT